jgi:hypothetical protein
MDMECTHAPNGLSTRKTKKKHAHKEKKRHKHVN